jgi:spermidine synthase
MNQTEYEIASTNYRVVEYDGLRSLRVKGNDVGEFGVMSLAEPDRIAAPYMAAMMRFVLFEPAPHDVLMLGLGCGLQASFIHRHLPRTRVTAVEIDPAMRDIAHRHFGLPPEDERLAVVIGSAHAYVAERTACCDVILSDAYDQSHTLAAGGGAFYRDCRRALRPCGILALNLAWIEIAPHLRALRQLFEMIVALPINPVQSVVLAFCRTPRLDGKTLQRRARAMEERLRLELPAFAHTWSLGLPAGTA